MNDVSALEERTQELQGRITRPRRERGSGSLVRVLKGARAWRIRLHQHGHVELIDVLPGLVPKGHTADDAIADAARTSYKKGTKKLSDNTGLIRYLMRHRHTTPFEMVVFKFRVKLPIFVARQWMRHRAGTFNEVSARYSILPDEFYVPTGKSVRSQSKVNKQGSDTTPLSRATIRLFNAYIRGQISGHKLYERLEKAGVARELARIGLPVNIYTEFIWQVNLHNLLHFLGLRMDGHAQQEIREYAEAIFALIQGVVPITCKAFLDYHFGAITLSRLEAEALRTGEPLDSTNTRELGEWDKKRKRLQRPK